MSNFLSSYSFTNRLLLLFMSMSFCATLSAQDYRAQLESDFYTYVNLLVEKDFEKSMDYIVDDFFEIIPRDQLVQLMEQAFSTPGFEIKLRDPKIIDVQKREKVDGKHYVFMNYSNLMDMKIIKEVHATEEEHKAYMDMMQFAFEDSFGEDNVKLNTEDSSFEIYSEKMVCSISENGVDSWKFLVVESNQKALLEQILPAAIFSKI